MKLAQTAARRRVLAAAAEETKRDSTASRASLAVGSSAPAATEASNEALDARDFQTSGPGRVSGDGGRVRADLPPDLGGMRVPEGADVGPTALKSCDQCGRSFNAKALEIHLRSCAKIFVSKRKQFDVKKQRAEGTDLERFKKMGGGGGFGDDDVGGFGGGGASWGGEFGKPRRATKNKTSAPVSKTKPSGVGSSKPEPKWKKESERFRAGLRGGGGGGGPGYDDDLVPCPHCGRSYNEHAAARHIPQCANIRAKPSRLVRGGGRGAHDRGAFSKPNEPGFGGELYRKTRAF